MGLQSEGPPDAADRVVAQPAALGHGPGAPMGRVPGRGLQRQRNHTLHVVIGNRSRPSAARFVRQFQPPQESGTPFPYRLRTLPGRCPPWYCRCPKSFWPAAPNVFGRRTHRSKGSTSSKISGGTDCHGSSSGLLTRRNLIANTITIQLHHTSSVYFNRYGVEMLAITGA